MAKKAANHVNNICIYMSSFDGYSDIWEGFFYRFDKYWKDCPYPVYLGCNALTPDFKRVEKILHSEFYPDWSSRALEHLSKIDEEYVLLMLEDYYLNKPVDSALIEKLYDYVQKFDLNFLRLVADPKPEVAIGGYPLIGFQSLGQLNRTNTHASIWKKSALIEIIRKGESLWEFEINGSVRSNRFAGKVCSVWKTALPYEMAVGKGMWFRDVYSHLCQENFVIDKEVRKVEPFCAMLKRMVVAAVGGAFRKVIPLRYRQCLKSFISPASYKS